MSFLFLKKNSLNTTTQIVVDSANTTTVENAFDRKLNTQWETIGYNTNTSTIFSVEIGTSTVIDKIFLQNHNLKQFRIFYNSATGNTFSNDINETTNSETANYYSFNSVTVSSVQIQCDVAQTGDTEKAIGEIYIGELLLNIERNPTAPDYSPKINREQVLHRMPDGGVRQFIIDQKFSASLRWKFLTESFTSNLEAIYNTQTSFFFVPYPTTTSWDSRAYHVIWANDFDFTYGENNKSAGFEGRISLKEV